MTSSSTGGCGYHTCARARGEERTHARFPSRHSQRTPPFPRRLSRSDWYVWVAGPNGPRALGNYVPVKAPPEVPTSRRYSLTVGMGQGGQGEAAAPPAEAPATADKAGITAASAAAAAAAAGSPPRTPPAPDTPRPRTGPPMPGDAQEYAEEHAAASSAAGAYTRSLLSST
jgi:hypothetical protein